MDMNSHPGYALSKKEGRVGSPEKPLSGLGEVTYKRYWKIKVFEYLRSASGSITMDGKLLVLLLSLADRQKYPQRHPLPSMTSTPP
jgi:hypothetical protein